MTGQNSHGRRFSTVLRITFLIGITMALLNAVEAADPPEKFADGKVCDTGQEPPTEADYAGVKKTGADLEKHESYFKDLAPGQATKCKSGKCNYDPKRGMNICGLAGGGGGGGSSSSSIQALSGIITVVVLVGLCLRQVLS